MVPRTPPAQIAAMYGGGLLRFFLVLRLRLADELRLRRRSGRFALEPAAAGVSSTAAFGAAQTHTVACSSSSTVSPSGSARSVTWMQWPIVRLVTSTSMWFGIDDGSTRTWSWCIVWSRMPPELRTPSAVPVKRSGTLDRHLLAGDELLEVDVQDVALERMALHLADQRADRRRRRSRAR